MGTKERRQREADSRRQEILSAARGLFWKNGYHGTSIPKIAEEAELAPGTIYLYFPSKEALYAELLLEGYGILHQRLLLASAQPRSPQSLAGSLVDVFLSFARDFPEYYNIIFFLVQRERSGGWEGIFPADTIARVHEQENLCKEVAATLLEKAGFQGSPERITTVEAVWSMLSGVIFHFGLDPQFESVACRAKELILSALFPAAPSGR